MLPCSWFPGTGLVRLANRHRQTQPQLPCAPFGWSTAPAPGSGADELSRAAVLVGYETDTTWQPLGRKRDDPVATPTTNSSEAGFRGRTADFSAVGTSLFHAVIYQRVRLTQLPKLLLWRASVLAWRGRLNTL
jgi:hypothetical protein